MKAVSLYAQVLVDVAVSQPSGSLESVTSELAEFAKMISESPMILKIFDNPTMSEDDKNKVLKEFGTKMKLSPLSDRFLSILVKRNRLNILPAILTYVETIQVEKKGGLMGELISAIPLEAGIAEGVAQALSKKLNKPVQLKEKVDPTLIAGMRVMIGGVTFDGSVKGKLDKLVGSFK
jgi:F-type H+-transporting ATPase subunit delta